MSDSTLTATVPNGFVMSPIGARLAGMELSDDGLDRLIADVLGAKADTKVDWSTLTDEELDAHTQHGYEKAECFSQTPDGISYADLLAETFDEWLDRTGHTVATAAATYRYDLG